MTFFRDIAFLAAGPQVNAIVRRLIMMPIRVCKKKLAVPIASLVFFGSAFLWVWTSGGYYRPLPKPACAIRLPLVLLEAGANGKGVHLIAMRQSGRQFPTIHFGTRFFGDGGYYHGYVVNALGLVIAVLPAEYSGGDYRVSPHTALVLPYWLLIIGSGFLLAVLTPIATRLRLLCRVSRGSGVAAGFILVLFAATNVVPSAWRPGGAIQPQTIPERVKLVLEPDRTYSEIMLIYGFPFTCYKKGIINGKSVDPFHGASVGWEPHKAMENVCVAIMTAFVIVLAIGFLRQHRTGQRTAPANKAVNPSGGSGGI